MVVAATIKQQNQTRMLSHTHTHTQRHLAIVRSTIEELYLEYMERNIRSSIVDIDSLLLYSSNFLFIRRRGPPLHIEGDQRVQRPKVLFTLEDDNI